MRKLIFGLVLSLAAAATQAAGLLEGTWRSDDASGGASPGTLVLGPKHKLVMHPDGFEALTGTWGKEGGMLIFTIPDKGEAVVAYTLEKDALSLQYSDGLRQVFKRQAIVNKRTSPAKAVRPNGSSTNHPGDK